MGEHASVLGTDETSVSQVLSTRGRRSRWRDLSLLECCLVQENDLNRIQKPRRTS